MWLRLVLILCRHHILAEFQTFTRDNLELVQLVCTLSCSLHKKTLLHKLLVEFHYRHSHTMFLQQLTCRMMHALACHIIGHRQSEWFSNSLCNKQFTCIAKIQIRRKPRCSFQLLVEVVQNNSRPQST